MQVPILALSPGDSPRLKGEDKAHVMRLAAVDDELPPILVDRQTMRVIDGVHRLMAASLKGLETIEVEFFDGTPEEAFLCGVQANVRHGLPLSQADRRAAALRILVSHPDMSDRMVAQSTGLGTRAVAELRRSTDAVPQMSTRMGRDGKVRPLNNATGRLRVAELIAEKPEASLRHLATLAGVSPATALDVRRRLERGEGPVPPRASGSAVQTPEDAQVAEVGEAAGPAKAIEAREAAEPARIKTAIRPVPAEAPDGTRDGAVDRAAPRVALDKLLRDPSLRHSEQGRRLLRMLQENAAGASDMPDIVASVPSHCLALVVEIARQNSKMWLDYARELDRRAKIVDPWSKR